MFLELNNSENITGPHFWGREKVEFRWKFFILNACVRKKKKYLKQMSSNIFKKQ